MCSLDSRDAVVANASTSASFCSPSASPNNHYCLQLTITAVALLIAARVAIACGCAAGVTSWPAVAGPAATQATNLDPPTIHSKTEVNEIEKH